MQQQIAVDLVDKAVTIFSSGILLVILAMIFNDQVKAFAQDVSGYLHLKKKIWRGRSIEVKGRCGQVASLSHRTLVLIDKDGYFEEIPNREVKGWIKYKDYPVRNRKGEKDAI